MQLFFTKHKFFKLQIVMISYVFPFAGSLAIAPNDPTTTATTSAPLTSAAPTTNEHLLKTPERRLKLTLRMKRSPIIDDLIECGTSLSEEPSNNFEPEYEILRFEGLMTDNDEMVPPTATAAADDDDDDAAGDSDSTTRRHKKRSKQRRKRKRHEKTHSDNEYATSLLNFKHNHHRSSSPLKSSASLFSHPLPPSPPMKRLRLIFGNETHTIDIPSMTSSVAATTSHGP
jgi:[histone H4]-N-methyl-L-lysine20 N-methyltransferase